MHARGFDLRTPLAASLLALMVAGPALAQATDDTGTDDASQIEGQAGTQSGDQDTGGTDTAQDSGTDGGSTDDGGTGTDAGMGTDGGDASDMEAGADAAGDQGGVVEPTGTTPTEQATIATDPAPSELGADVQADGDAAGSMPQAAGEMDALTEPGPGQAPQASDQMGGEMATDEQMGRTVMLDIERFGRDIYERGFRQGYIHGAMEARMQLMEQVQSMGQGQAGGQGQQMGIGQDQLQTGRPQTHQGQRPMPPQGGQASGQQGGAMPNQPGMTGSAERGAVVILPPGVSPEAFLNRLQQQSQ